MNSKSFILLLVYIFACVSLSCQKPIELPILARVDNDRILVSDFLEAFEEQKELYGDDILSDPEGNLAVKRKILKSLIEEKLLLQRAQEKQTTLTSEEEKNLILQLRSGWNQVSLEKILQKKGLSFDQWVEKQKQKKRIEKLIDEEVVSSIALGPEEIRRFYSKHADSFREPDQVRCRHMVTDKKEKAEKILSLLNEGQNFASLAQKYSESPERANGGDLGYVTRGQYPQVFEAACFTLATGQTSGIISSEYGFHIFRVIEKKPGRRLSLKEATPFIEKRLKEEKSREALPLWLEEIEKNKKIVVDEKKLKEVLLPL